MAKPTVSANNLSVVHAGSQGTLTSTLPDICCIPTPAGKTPVPFMNSAESKDLSGGTVTVTIEGSSVAVMGSTISTSKGDVGGILGGIISGGTQGQATTIMYSPNVIMEMKPVIRKSDMAIMNDINTVSLQGWDQGDVEAVAEKLWVTFLTLSTETLRPLSGVKLKITVPGKGTASYVSAPGGRISIVGVDAGSCRVELDEGNADTVIKIHDDCRVSGLDTRQQHVILIDRVIDEIVSS